MGIKYKFITFAVATFMAMGMEVTNLNRPVTVQAAGKMHYFAKCNNAKNLFDRRAKFLGVVYQRPVRSYDINGNVINKKWVGNIFTNGYRYIHGKKYYHLAFKPQKYLSASELNAHNSKNHPNEIVVYTATKTFTPYQPGSAYDDGSVMENPTSIKKNQAVYRNIKEEKSEIRYYKNIYQKWQETGENPGGSGYNFDALKTVSNSWYVNACMGTMGNPKRLREYPQFEQKLILPQQKKYLKRGGRYIDGLYKDRKKAGLQFTNQSIREGYCWSDVTDALDGLNETDSYSDNLTTLGHDNLVTVLNWKKRYPKSYFDHLKTLYKVHLYI